jgi:hypothetical protein
MAFGEKCASPFLATAQPVWFRVLKWTVALGVSAILWRGPYFWAWILSALSLGVTVHLIWRWKTKGWTQPWEVGMTSSERTGASFES